jgi:hypothetical protein
METSRRGFLGGYRWRKEMEFANMYCASSTKISDLCKPCAVIDPEALTAMFRKIDEQFFPEKENTE